MKYEKKKFKVSDYKDNVRTLITMNIIEPQTCNNLRTILMIQVARKTAIKNVKKVNNYI